MYWELRDAQPFQVHPSYYEKCERRFRGVFFKLLALELEEFRKVVVLDLDMIVKSNHIDELFERETPAAVFRGNAKCAPGARRPAGTFVDHDGKLRGGINAGLMVLRPSKAELEDMRRKLLQRTNDPTTGPEQDFLTRYYEHTWNKLPIRFNYQLHQLGFLNRGAQPERRMPFEEIEVIHFSGDYGPRDWLFDRKGFKTREQWERKELIPKYGNIDQQDMRVVLECIRHWFETWNAVEKTTEYNKRRRDAVVERSPWVHPSQPSCQACFKRKQQHRPQRWKGSPRPRQPCSPRRFQRDRSERALRQQRRQGGVQKRQRSVSMIRMTLRNVSTQLLRWRRGRSPTASAVCRS